MEQAAVNRPVAGSSPAGGVQGELMRSDNKTLALFAFSVTLAVCISFGIGAGLMYLFANCFGFNPVIISGILSAGYCLDRLAKLFDRK